MENNTILKSNGDAELIEQLASNAIAEEPAAIVPVLTLEEQLLLKEQEMTEMRKQLQAERIKHENELHSLKASTDTERAIGKHSAMTQVVNTVLEILTPEQLGEIISKRYSEKQLKEFIGMFDSECTEYICRSILQVSDGCISMDEDLAYRIMRYNDYESYFAERLREGGYVEPERIDPDLDDVVNYLERASSSGCRRAVCAIVEGGEEISDILDWLDDVNSDELLSAIRDKIKLR